MIEDDTHDLLTQAYIEYYIENAKFEKRVSNRTHKSSRRSLRKIIKLAQLRQKEIHEKYANKKQNEGKNI